LCGDTEGEAVRDDRVEQDAEEEEEEAEEEKEGEKTGIEMEEETEWVGGEGRVEGVLEDGATAMKKEEEEGASRNFKPTGVV